MENIVHELTLKLLDVEEELKIFKNNESSEKPAVELNDHKEDLEEANISTNKYIEKELEDSTEDSTKGDDDSVQVFPEIELSKISDEKDEAVKNNSENKQIFNCDHCSFKFIDKNLFQKHMDNKLALNNKPHQCKTCRERFNSLSDVLEHDQKEHQDKQVDNDTSFVFSESMLDEFDV